MSQGGHGLQTLLAQKNVAELLATYLVVGLDQLLPHRDRLLTRCQIEQELRSPIHL
jgi:hypothetical protein